MSPRGTGYTSPPEDTGLCLELVGWRALGLQPWEQEQGDPRAIEPSPVPQPCPGRNRDCFRAGVEPSSLALEAIKVPSPSAPPSAAKEHVRGETFRISGPVMMKGRSSPSRRLSRPRHVDLCLSGGSRVCRQSGP